MLLEPRVSGLTAKNIVRKLGFDNWFIEDATGFSGGIWILWSGVKVKILESSKQYVHFDWELDIEKGLCTAVYASPVHRVRHKQRTDLLK